MCHVTSDVWHVSCDMCIVTSLSCDKPVVSEWWIVLVLGGGPSLPAVSTCGHPSKSALFCVNCKVYSVQCSVYTVYCSIYSIQCAVSCVQCALFSVQFAVCSLECTVWCLQCAGYSVLITVCCVKSTTCSVQYKVYILQLAVFILQCAVCSIQGAVWSAQFLVCIVKYNLVFSVQCIVCSVQYAVSTLVSPTTRWWIISLDSAWQRQNFQATRHPANSQAPAKVTKVRDKFSSKYFQLCFGNLAKLEPDLSNLASWYICKDKTD